MAKKVISEGLAFFHKQSFRAMEQLYLITLFVTALHHLDDWNAAEKLFDEVQLKAQKTKEPIDLLPFFDTLVQIGRIKKASEILDEINKTQDSSIYSISRIAKAHVKLGHIVKAQQILNHHYTVLLKTSPNSRVRTKSGYISSRDGDLHELAIAMYEIGMYEEAYKALRKSGNGRNIAALVEIGRTKEAMAILHKLTQSNYSFSFSELMSTSNAIRIIKQSQEAKYLADKTIDLVRKVSQKDYQYPLSRDDYDSPIEIKQLRMLFGLAKILIEIGQSEEAKKVTLNIIAIIRQINSQTENVIEYLIPLAELFANIEKTPATH